jgi:hypothetical protein
MGVHSTVVGSGKVKNLIVSSDDMVTLTFDKKDVRAFTRALNKSLKDDRTTDTVRVWVRNGKAVVSNRLKAPYSKKY